jgi:hypothetical protein
MSSRARIFAAVTLLAGCLAGPAAWAQATNLEAGKSASQLFAGTCNACHKSPRGLLKTVSPGSLSGFLREHYTTGGEMASQLATYLISNGASDRQAKQGADKQGTGADQTDRPGRKNRNVPGQEAARPDDTPPPPGDGVRQSRRRLTPPGEQPEEGRPVANAPAQSDIERGPDGRKLPAKQRNRLGKQPGAEEPSMANEPPKAEPAKTEPAKTESGTDDKAKVEPMQEMGNAGSKPDAQSKSADEVKPQPVKSEAAKIEAPKDSASGMVRRDPAPPVTPAPPAAAATSAPAPAVAPGASPEQAAPRPPAPAAPPPAAVTASAPPPLPSPPADGPPAPPISR